MKWLIIALICLLPNLATAQGGMGPGPGTVHSTGGGGTVAVDVKSAAVINCPALPTLCATVTVPLTVGASANAIEVMVIWVNGTVPAASAATWNGVPMTAITGTTSGSHGGCSCATTSFGILAPATGAHNVVVSWTGLLEAHAVAISFTGVNQSSIAAAFPNGTNVINDTSTASPITATVTSATGHIVTAFAGQGIGAFGTINGTLIAKDDVTGPAIGVAGNYNTGAATVSPSFAFGGPGVWAIVANDVAP